MKGDLEPPRGEGTDDEHDESYNCSPEEMRLWSKEKHGDEKGHQTYCGNDEKQGSFGSVGGIDSGPRAAADLESHEDADGENRSDGYEDEGARHFGWWYCERHHE